MQLLSIEELRFELFPALATLYERLNIALKGYLSTDSVRAMKSLGTLAVATTIAGGD